MAKRKKRNAVTLISLLLALSVLIVIYVWYSNKQTSSDDTEDTESVTLATIDTTQVTAIHFIGSDVDIHLTSRDGTWISEEEPDRPINQSNVNSMLNVISEINAYQTVTKEPESLSEYGLDQPYAFIEATLSDGSTVSLTLGNEAISGDGYYAMVNDLGAVYLVTISYGSGLDLSNYDMTEIEEAPEITAANITYISVDNRDGEDIELKYNEEGTQDISGSNLYTWQILKPYGEGYSADSSKVSDIQSNYTSFNYVDCVDYKGDDLSKYGLDNPAATINIGYYEETTLPTPTPVQDDSDSSQTAAQTIKTNKEYKIYVGNQDDSGYYYIKVDGSNMIYTLSDSTVEKMLQVDVFSLMNLYPDIPNIENVDKITAGVAGKDYVMEISRTSATNEDGEDTTEATYYYQGKEEEESLFKSVYQKLITPRYDAELTEKVDIASLAPVLTLNFHLFGDKELTVNTTFLTYNNNFYLVDKGTGKYFLVDKRTVDDAINAVTTFNAGE